MNVIRKLLGETEMETERLILRRWKPTDFGDFVKFFSDPLVMEAAGARHAETLQEAESAFRHVLRSSDCYAIVLKASEKPIGQIKFQTDLRRPQINSLSIGYELQRDMWGNGYMPEALGAMIVCAFETRKADVLAISHFTVNDRSRRVIEKCGFRREGVMLRAYRRFDGTIFDDVCYSILKEEYFAHRERYLCGREENQG